LVVLIEHGTGDARIGLIDFELLIAGWARWWRSGHGWAFVMIGEDWNRTEVAGLRWWGRGEMRSGLRWSDEWFDGGAGAMVVKGAWGMGFWWVHGGDVGSEACVWVSCGWLVLNWWCSGHRLWWRPWVIWFMVKGGSGFGLRWRSLNWLEDGWFEFEWWRDDVQLERERCIMVSAREEETVEKGTKNPANSNQK
jgi:hypothetical protein